LYIYGYLNRVRSSRLLEREATRNLEVMWLLGKLTRVSIKSCGNKMRL
jgi:transposase